MSNLKKSYSNPELKVHGNVEILTQATGKKGKLDKDFPAGTSFNDLTFS